MHKIPFIAKQQTLFILASVIFILTFFIRYNQGGLDIEIDILRNEREILDKHIQAVLPSPQAELLSGILLGQNKKLPGQLKLALRDTSTLHIVVASGQNLTMVGGFFMLLSGLIKRKFAIPLSLISIIFYVLLTGAQIPILRAAVMVSLGLLANILGREKDSIWVLAVTAGSMLLINPHWLFELSFQLSVLATIGVVVVAPLIFKKLSMIPNFISQDLAITLGAQLMIFPIIAQNFHQLSIVALPVNLLVLWTIPFIMIGGAILLVTSFIASATNLFIIPPLGVLMGFLLNILLTYFIYIVNFFAGFSWAWIYVGEYSWLVWVGYYLLLAGVLKYVYDLRQNGD